MNPVQLVQLVYCSTCMTLLVTKILLGLPSDAESREEQDGSKQKFLVGTTAKL